MDSAAYITQAVLTQAMRHPDIMHHARPEAFCYPAADFETEAGLTGIAKAYTLPQGKTPESLFLELYPQVVQISLLESYHQRLAPYDKGITASELEAKANQAQHHYEHYAHMLIHNRHQLDTEERDEGLLTARELRDHALEWRSMAQLAAQFGALHPIQTQQALKQARMHFEQEAKACYAELEALNPELQVLTPQIENNGQRWNVLHGIFSHFNVADIHHFSIAEKNLTDSLQDRQWAQRYRQVEKESGVTLNWVPASSTMMRILEQLQQRGQSAEASR